MYHCLPYFNQVSSCTVEELRSFLKSHSLPVVGRKADLVERVINHLSKSV